MSAVKDSFLKEELALRKNKGLLRKMRLLEGAQGPRVIIDGEPVINLCSNNYLGLANEPRINEAAIEGVRRYGVGSGASRLVCGNMYLHKRLEEKIASFKGTQASLVYSSGYAANIGIIPSIVGRSDIVFSDRLNHASIIDGIILSRSRFRRYPHKDVRALEELLRESKSRTFLHSRRASLLEKARDKDFDRRLIVTETVFSMDGDITPLPEIVEIAGRQGCLVMVDEAHATGVLGKNGAGAIEHFGLKNGIDIQMGTLSKAIGALGGYVCGSQELIDYLINCSRSFGYTTALPPAIAAACIKALEIIESEPQLRQRLWENVSYLKSGLDNLRLNTLASQTPIIPLLIGDTALTMKFSLRLFEKGVFIQGIRPPTVPQGESRLRLTVTAGHTKEDLTRALEAIGKVAKQLCLI